MSIFDSIEKLITEHGSAAILRERLEKAKEQYALLEKGKADADAKVVDLDARLLKLQQVNQRLTEQIRGMETNGNPVLKVVSTMPDAEYTTPSDV